jgi:hypothetical protein
VLAVGPSALAMLGLVATSAQAGKWREQVHPQISGKSSILEDVVAIGARDVWAVGRIWGPVGGVLEFRTHVLHFDGISWSISPSKDTEGAPATNFLWGVDARTANDVWTVGSFQLPGEPSKTLIEHWDGTAWSIVASPSPSKAGNFLQAVAVTTAGDAWAVGTSVVSSSFTELPLALHWDGAVWSQVKVAQPSFCTGNTYLTDVAARQPNNVLASGYCTASGKDQAFILRWNGRKWHVVAGPGQIPAKSQLEGITVLSASDAWAVGGSATLSPLILHWDGIAWATVSPPPARRGAHLMSVDARGSDNVWAVGIGRPPQPPFAGVFSAHWNGTQWTTVRAGNFTSLNGVAMAGQRVWAVGYSSPESVIVTRRN